MINGYSGICIDILLGAGIGASIAKVIPNGDVSVGVSLGGFGGAIAGVTAAISNNFIKTTSYIAFNGLLGAGIGASIAKVIPNGDVSVGVFWGSLDGAIAGAIAAISNNFIETTSYVAFNGLLGAGIGASIAKVIPNGDVSVGVSLGGFGGAIAGATAAISNNFIKTTSYVAFNGLLGAGIGASIAKVIPNGDVSAGVSLGGFGGAIAGAIAAISNNFIETTSYVAFNGLLGAEIGIGIAKVIPNGDVGYGLLLGSLDGAIAGAIAAISNNFIEATSYVAFNALLGAGIGAGIAKVIPNGYVYIGVLLGGLSGAVVGTVATMSDDFIPSNYIVFDSLLGAGIGAGIAAVTPKIKVHRIKYIHFGLTYGSIMGIVTGVASDISTNFIKTTGYTVISTLLGAGIGAGVTEIILKITPTTLSRITSEYVSYGYRAKGVILGSIGGETIGIASSISEDFIKTIGYTISATLFGTETDTGIAKTILLNIKVGVKSLGESIANASAISGDFVKITGYVAFDTLLGAGIGVGIIKIIPNKGVSNVNLGVSLGSLSGSIAGIATVISGNFVKTTSYIVFNTLLWTSISFSCKNTELATILGGLSGAIVGAVAVISDDFIKTTGSAIFNALLGAGIGAGLAKVTPYGYVDIGAMLGFYGGSIVGAVASISGNFIRVTGYTIFDTLLGTGIGTVVAKITLNEDASAKVFLGSLGGAAIGTAAAVSEDFIGVIDSLLKYSTNISTVNNTIEFKISNTSQRLSKIFFNETDDFMNILVGRINNSSFYVQNTVWKKIENIEVSQYFYHALKIFFQEKGNNVDILQGINFAVNFNSSTELDKLKMFGVRQYELIFQIQKLQYGSSLVKKFQIANKRERINIMKAFQLFRDNNDEDADIIKLIQTAMKFNSAAKVELLETVGVKYYNFALELHKLTKCIANDTTCFTKKIAPSNLLMLAEMNDTDTYQVYEAFLMLKEIEEIGDVNNLIEISREFNSRAKISVLKDLLKLDNKKIAIEMFQKLQEIDFQYTHYAKKFTDDRQKEIFEIIGVNNINDVFLLYRNTKHLKIEEFEIFLQALEMVKQYPEYYKYIHLFYEDKQIILLKEIIELNKDEGKDYIFQAFVILHDKFSCQKDQLFFFNSREKILNLQKISEIRTNVMRATINIVFATKNPISREMILYAAEKIANIDPTLVEYAQFFNTKNALQILDRILNLTEENIKTFFLNLSEQDNKDELVISELLEIIYIENSQNKKYALQAFKKLNTDNYSDNIKFASQFKTYYQLKALDVLGIKHLHYALECFSEKIIKDKLFTINSDQYTIYYQILRKVLVEFYKDNPKSEIMVKSLIGSNHYVAKNDPFAYNNYMYFIAKNGGESLEHNLAQAYCEYIKNIDVKRNTTSIIREYLNKELHKNFFDQLIKLMELNDNAGTELHNELNFLNKLYRTSLGEFLSTSKNQENFIIFEEYVKCIDLEESQFRNDNTMLINSYDAVPRITFNRNQIDKILDKIESRKGKSSNCLESEQFTAFLTEDNLIDLNKQENTDKISKLYITSSTSDEFDLDSFESSNKTETILAKVASLSFEGIYTLEIDYPWFNSNIEHIISNNANYNLRNKEVKFPCKIIHKIILSPGICFQSSLSTPKETKSAVKSLTKIFDVEYQDQLTILGYEMKDVCGKVDDIYETIGS